MIRKAAVALMLIAALGTFWLLLASWFFPFSRYVYGDPGVPNHAVDLPMPGCDYDESKPAVDLPVIGLSCQTDRLTLWCWSKTNLPFSAIQDTRIWRGHGFGWIINDELLRRGDRTLTRLHQIEAPAWFLQILFVLFLAYPAGVLARRSYLHHQRRRRGGCVHCGYSLTGNVSGVCPECGTPMPGRETDAAEAVTPPDDRRAGEDGR